MMPNDDSSILRIKALAISIMAWTLGTASIVLTADTAVATNESPALPRAAQIDPVLKVSLDRSGHAQTGKASFYANHYAGKTMADGTPMRLYSNNAASLTLPLGTTARVTNLATGRSAIVTIRDRGPYVRGRIVDLSPATAHKIGIDRKMGLATVEVAPLRIPMMDGTVKVIAQANGARESG